MADSEAVPRASTSADLGASGNGDVSGESVNATEGGAASSSSQTAAATASTSAARASVDTPRSPATASSPAKTTPVASDFAHAALRKFKLVFLGEQSGEL